MRLCRLNVALAFVLVAGLGLGLGLAGCGRKGPLDPPPSSLTPPPPAAAPANYVDPLNPIGPPQAPVRSTQAGAPSQPLSKSFILDPLLQ